MSVMERVDERIGSRRLLDHPFYEAWSRGELPREALNRYAEQYYQWVAAFPTFLSAIHANCPSLAVRQEVLENLIDEERGPDNHPELWLRFADALGLDRDAVLHAEPLPETREAIAAYRGICRDLPYVGGLAAVYAYESQQPAVMRTKREGLVEHYGVTTGHDYFAVHESVDVEHSAAERRLVESGAAGMEQVIDGAVEAGLNATYTLLDGIYSRYVAGRTAACAQPPAAAQERFLN
jgi:pyrroloquinoline-quinone synthase